MEIEIWVLSYGNDESFVWYDDANKSSYTGKHWTFCTLSHNSICILNFPSICIIQLLELRSFNMNKIEQESGNVNEDRTSKPISNNSLWLARPPPSALEWPKLFEISNRVPSRLKVINVDNCFWHYLKSFEATSRATWSWTRDTRELKCADCRVFSWVIEF